MAKFVVYQFEEGDGEPFAGVKIYHYEPGTTTDKDVWVDEGETTLAPQPVQGDSRGVVFFYAHGLYRIRVETNAGILLYDWDNVDLSGSDVAIEDCSLCTTGHVLKYVGPDCDFECGYVSLVDNVEGVLECNHGGTDNSCPTAAGQLLIANGTTTHWEINTLTAGAGIDITNADGAITIAASAGISQAAFSSLGLVGFNNLLTPDTKFDLTALAVQLRAEDNTSIVVRFRPAVITNDILALGVANGTDQTTAFPPGSWIHLYWIWNGNIPMASVSSLSPPTIGPTLPAGYTHWGYATAVKLDAGSALLNCRAVGAWVYYRAKQFVLIEGNATVETFVDMSGFVPPNAQAIQVWAGFANSDAFTNEPNMELGFISGQNFTSLVAGGDPEGDSQVVIIPNEGQGLYYHINLNGGTNKRSNIAVQAYKIPNGGE